MIAVDGYGSKSVRSDWCPGQRGRQGGEKATIADGRQTEASGGLLLGEDGVRGISVGSEEVGDEIKSVGRNESGRHSG